MARKVAMERRAMTESMYLVAGLRSSSRSMAYTDREVTSVKNTPDRSLMIRIIPRRIY